MFGGRAEYTAWLYRIGFYSVCWTFDPQVCFDGYWIACGPSARDNSINHSVVYLKNRMVFDHHPSRKGIEKITEWMILVPRNPAKSNQAMNAD